jgi:methionine-rich copper-binding protein CopC
VLHHRRPSVWFTEQLDAAFSTLEVLNERGERVDNGPPQTAESNPDMLLVHLKSIGPGTYRVTWRVLSMDTHVTEDDFTFQVAGNP